MTRKTRRVARYRPPDRTRSGIELEGISYQPDDAALDSLMAVTEDALTAFPGATALIGAPPNGILAAKLIQQRSHRHASTA